MTADQREGKAVAFDPNKYKHTTRQQWEDYAEGWNAWAPLLEDWLGDATQRMLDMAGVAEGSRVVDVAAGAGGQSVAAGVRAGQSGSVLATDLSPTILTYAAKAAADAGLTNLSTRELDGEKLTELEAGSFDAAISRVGFIYFPDRHAALTGIHHALREGGRFATVTYSTAATNEFFSIPVKLIREAAQLPAPQPGQPGPFSLADPAVLEGELIAAGFHDVEVQVVSAPVHLPTAAECVRFEKESFGALHQMLGGLDPDAREQVWVDMETELRKFETADGFVGPCELVIAGASK